MGSEQVSRVKRVLHAPMRRFHALPVLALLLAALSGCGKSSAPEHASSGGPAAKLAPVTAQGAVSVATRNTTRLGGADAATDAAGVARAAYPGLTAATRPQAVVLVNERDWPAALAASALASAPLGAPILYADGNQLPEVTLQTLEACSQRARQPSAGRRSSASAPLRRCQPGIWSARSPPAIPLSPRRRWSSCWPPPTTAHPAR